MSLPDDLYEAVNRAVEVQGVSRSALFAAALIDYLRSLEAKSLTEQINAAIDTHGEDDETTTLVTTHGLRTLADERW